METNIFVSPAIMALGFKVFEKYHAKYLSHDSLTAQERYVKAGGKLPDKVKKVID